LRSCCCWRCQASASRRGRWASQTTNCRHANRASFNSTASRSTTAPPCWCARARSRGPRRPTPFPGIEPVLTPTPGAEPSPTAETGFEPTATPLPLPEPACDPLVLGFDEPEPADAPCDVLRWTAVADDEAAAPLPTATVEPQHPELPADPAERARFMRDRVRAMHDALPAHGRPLGTVNTALVRAIDPNDPDAPDIILVASSTGQLTDEQVAVLHTWEEPVGGIEQHAELNAIEEALRRGLRPVEVTSRWRVCDPCAEYLTEQRVTPTSRLLHPEQFPELREQQIPFLKGNR
jgi:hypothetical protein